MFVRLKSGRKNYGPGGEIVAWDLTIKGEPYYNQSVDEPPKRISMKLTPSGKAPGIAKSKSHFAPDSNYKEVEINFSIQECRRFVKALASYVDQVELMGALAEIKIPMRVE